MPSWSNVWNLFTWNLILKIALFPYIIYLPGIFWKFIHFTLILVGCQLFWNIILISSNLCLYFDSQENWDRILKVVPKKDLWSCIVDKIVPLVLTGTSYAMTWQFFILLINQSLADVTIRLFLMCTTFSVLVHLQW